MRIARRIGMAAVIAALAAGSSAGHAGVPQKHDADPPVDERLLEFLGSVDPAADSGRPYDGSWLAYLSQVNIGKVARPPQAGQAPQAQQAKPASSAAGADKPGG